MGLWSYWTGADQRESDRLDAERAALNDRQRAKYGEPWYQQTLENDARGDADEAAAAAAMWDDFRPAALVTNLGESAAAVTPGLRSFLDTLLSTPFKAIPPVGWLLILGAAFFCLGGHLWLRRVIASKG